MDVDAPTSCHPALSRECRSTSARFIPGHPSRRPTRGQGGLAASNRSSCRSRCCRRSLTARQPEGSHPDAPEGISLGLVPALGGEDEDIGTGQRPRFLQHQCLEALTRTPRHYPRRPLDHRQSPQLRSPPPTRLRYLWLSTLDPLSPIRPRLLSFSPSRLSRLLAYSLIRLLAIIWSATSMAASRLDSRAFPVPAMSRLFRDRPTCG